MVSANSEADFSYCQDTIVADNTSWSEVRIQLMAEHIAQRGVLIRDVFFEGGDVLRCYRGRFRFCLEGCEPIEIGEQEAIVVYPGQRVTIEALDKVNLIVYGLQADGYWKPRRIHTTGTVPLRPALTDADAEAHCGNR